jgi:hypothetical protein
VTSALAQLKPDVAFTSVPIVDAPDHVYVYDPVTKCEARFMNVTPELANEWMEKYNGGNRSKRPRVVSGYADDMTHDRWAFTADRVGFGGQDRLLYDGQHRLDAIIKSGKTQRLLVVRGLAPEARAAIDGGVIRKLRDDLMIDGHVSKNLDCLVAITTRALLWEMDPPVRLPGAAPRKVSRVEQIGFIEAHPELDYSARRGMQVYKAVGRKIPPSVIGFVHWLASGVDEQAAGVFFEQLETLTNVPPRSPVTALFKRTLEPTGLTSADWLYLMLKAWILFRSERPTDRLQLPRNRLQGRPMTSDMIPDPTTLLGATGRANDDGQEPDAGYAEL